MCLQASMMTPMAGAMGTAGVSMQAAMGNTQGSNPQVGDRVLVEASYNPNMPFKWNATRIQ
ncbi:unnamed protein product, partial [Timema podura]|nr:unnamed protein product [Timema podura]